VSRKSKKERKVEREAARAAVRQAERRRNAATGVVLALVVVLGVVLVWLSLDGGPDAADLAEGTAEPGDDAADFDEPRPVEPRPEPQPPPDPDEDERPIACGGDLPERAGETKPVHTTPERVIEDGVTYEAVIATSCGTVVAELDAERAPEGVNAFVFLATTGFYDGLEVFRHASGIDVFQTGAGSNNAAFDVGYHLPDELAAADADGYPAGTLAYANAGPGTAGSQFFVVYGDAFQDAVDGGALQPIYTRFGLVSEGLDVLEELADIPVEGEQPQERIYLETVMILADGEPLPAEPAATPQPEED
jgi:cyclophilin family peptidyl-prolyl cis-trans isomerase